MSKRLAPVLIWTVAMLACGGPRFEAPQKPHEPLLEKLERPPLNLPSSGSPSASRVPRPPMATLPPGSQPAAILVGDARRVDGAMNLAGRVRTSAGRIEFVPEKQAALQILYRLPPGLRPPTDVDAVGTLLFEDRTTAAGPHRQLVIVIDGSPLLAEFRLKAPTPNTVSIGPRLQLRQLPQPGEGIQDVSVEILENGSRSHSLPLRTATMIKAAGGPLLAFVYLSHVVNEPDPTGQYPGGYLLHAWVVRATGP